MDLDDILKSAEDHETMTANDGGASLGDAKKSGKGRGVVFLCWGKWAAERVAKLDAVSLQRQR